LDETIALDIETYGKNAVDCFQADVRLIQIKIPKEPAYLIDLYQIKELAPLKALLESVEVIGHNLAFEYKFLKHRLGIQLKHCFDTQAAARILNNNDKEKTSYLKLGDLISDRLDIDLSKDEGGSDWSARKLTFSQLQYAADDVGFLHNLKDRLTKEIKDAEMDNIFDLEMHVLPISAQLHLTGIAVDRTEVQAIIDGSASQVEECNAKVRRLLNNPELNVNSPKQLLVAFQEAGVEISTTDERTLAGLEHPAAKAILDARGASKKVEEATRYLKAIAVDGRIHAEFDPLGTNTGRFDSSKPNIQNVSKPNKSPIRRAFKASPGRCLVDSDFTMMEIYVVAILAQEKKMLQAFAEGRDIHRKTAAEVIYQVPEDQITKEQRTTAKPCNFGFLYGQQAEGFKDYAMTWGVRLTLAEAEILRDKFFAYYSDLQAWHKKLWAEGATEGRTLLGRRRRLAKGGSWWQFQARGNLAVQGSCADTIKLALCTMANALPATAAIVHTVHDEIIVEADLTDAEAVRAMVQKHMEDAAKAVFGVAIPADAKICSSWADKDL
jgi:DNA polymerase I